MGCGQKAIAQDEEDWDTLCKSANLKVNWDVYSDKASYAKEGYTKLGLKGTILQRYVDAVVVIKGLVEEQRAENLERKLLSELKAKYQE